MAILGFTAEASVGPTKEVYRVQVRYGHGLGFGDLYQQQWFGGGMGGAGWAGEASVDAAMAMASGSAELEGLATSGDDAEVVADEGPDDVVAVDDLGAGIGVSEAPATMSPPGMAEDVVQVGDAEVVADEGPDDVVAVDDLGAGIGVSEAPATMSPPGMAEDVVQVGDDQGGSLA
jgi:hypothetical protein